MAAAEQNTGRGSSRERVPTIRGKAHQIEITSRAFRHATTLWRRDAVELERLLTDSRNVDDVRAVRDGVDRSSFKVQEAYDKLNDLLDEEDMNDVDRRFDVIEAENHSLMRRAAAVIRDIETLRTEVTVDDCRNRDDKLETASNLGSRYSRTSSTGYERAQTKAKIAELMVEKQHLALANELECKRRAVQLETELAKAQARERVFAEYENDDISPEYERQDETFVKHPVLKKQPNMNPRASTFVPSGIPDIQPTGYNSQSTAAVVQNVTDTAIHMNVDHVPTSAGYLNTAIPVNNEPGVHSTVEQIQPVPSTLDILLSALTEQISLSRLPPPEPGVFTGDPLTYPSWKSAFHTLIERRGIPEVEKVHYLKRYLGGKAKEAVEGFLLLSSPEAFKRAKDVLEKRYGDSFVVAGAFRDKLADWPKIQNHDGQSLRKFSDFLIQCCQAMKSIPSLGVLNDERENHRLLMKLPDWLVAGWGRIAARWKDENRTFPPFSEFVRFLEREADMACDPITSLQSLKSSGSGSSEYAAIAGKASAVRSKEYTNNKRMTNKKNSRSFNTSSKQESIPQNTVKPEEKFCTYCKKGHFVDDCFAFKKLDPEKKRDVVMKHGLCFGCLEFGHRLYRCRKKLTCKLCQDFHPTSLHPGNKKEDGANSTAKDQLAVKKQPLIQSANTGAVFLGGVSGTCKTTMVVPVYISHHQRPEEEQLVYALLDTQSDTTFMLSSTASDLGLDGTKTCLQLSTMSSCNQLIDTEKYTGLVVRAYNSQLKISLPAVYSRDEIPVNRETIPTPESARSWRHLEVIAGDLMPMDTCQIGILIGYNCSKALLPRDVIAPPEGTSAPYAVRTDLGWSIVGDVRTSKDDILISSVTSHRMMTCEVNPDLLGKPIGGEKSIPEVIVSFPSTIKEIINPSQIIRMIELDFSERHSEAAYSQDDQKFLKQITSGIHRTSDNRYEMPLPLKNTEMVLPDNRNGVVQRLKQLRTKMLRNPKYKEDYTAFMDRMMDGGFAERVPEQELQQKDGRSWYIPHH